MFPGQVFVFGGDELRGTCCSTQPSITTPTTWGPIRCRDANLENWACSAQLTKTRARLPETTSIGSIPIPIPSMYGILFRYLHLVDFYGKCREIYHTSIVWDTSWWLKQPIWKICSPNWESFPPGSGWTLKIIFELPPPRYTVDGSENPDNPVEVGSSILLPTGVLAPSQVVVLDFFHQQFGYIYLHLP